MLKIYYDIIAIYLPILLIVFSLGNYFFTFGEFKEHKVRIHPLMTKIGIKIFSICIVELFIIHYAFANYKYSNFNLLSILFSIYIDFELIITNNVLFKFEKITHYCCKLKANESILVKLLKSILKKFRIMVSFTILLSIIIVFLLTYNSFFHFSYFIVSLYLVHILLIATNLSLLTTKNFKLCE